MNGTSLRIMVALNLVLCIVVFVTVMESVKIDTMLEKVLVVATLISLSLFELMLLTLLWLA
jgi:hypothetical protein